MMDNFNCPLVSIAGSFDSVSFHHTTPNYDDLLDAVVSYEKLRNQLSKLRRKIQKQEKGIVGLKGRSKVSGRKSMLESNPELIKHVRELKSGSYTKQEVSDILFKMEYKNSKGNPFHRAQITEFYRQNQGLN